MRCAWAAVSTEERPISADTRDSPKAAETPSARSKTRATPPARRLSRHEVATKYLQAFRKAERKHGYEHPDPKTLLDRILVLEEVLGQAPSAIAKLKGYLEAFLEDPSVQDYLLTKSIEASFIGNGDVSAPFLSRYQRQRLALLKDLDASDRGIVFRRLFRAPDRSVGDEVDEILNEFLGKSVDNRLVDKETGTSEGGSSQLNKSFCRVRDHDRPRWADENRPTVRFPMQMSSQIITEIDDAARIAGQNRNEWVCNALQRFMSTFPEQTPEDSPEYKASKTVTLRLPPRLNERVAELAQQTGLNKTEWARRIIRQQLARHDQSPNPSND